MALGRLDQREGAALVHRIAKGKTLPTEVLNAIIIRGSYEEAGRELRVRYAGLADRVFSYWPFTIAERAGWSRMAEAFRGAG